MPAKDSILITRKKLSKSYIGNLEDTDGKESGNGQWQ